MAKWFFILASLLVVYSVDIKLYILLWPAANFLVLGIAYATEKHRIFGKRADGTLATINVLFLLPYYLLLWSFWHVMRVLQNERVYDELEEKIVIGRRLFAKELPENIETVVDLTCEFCEQKSITQKYHYRCFPILDGSITEVSSFAEFACEIAKSEQRIYIHCAQGHGRTSMFTCLLLIAQKKYNNVDEAMAFIQQKRPRANMRKQQWLFTESCAREIKNIRNE